MEETMNIYQRLAKIRKQVEVIQKNKSGYGYKYVSEDEILARISVCMDKFNLSLVPNIKSGSTSVVPYAYKKTKTTKSGEIYEENNNEIIVSSDMTWSWVNNDDPSERVDVDWCLVGQQSDAAQAFGAGLTYSNRYFLLKYFNIPTFDIQSIYTTVNKVRHQQGLDVLIVDYFKGSGEGDAFNSYQELGRFVDTVKNKICGDMNIAGIGAAQANSTGRLADSAKIARNASTIAMITDKTPEEIEADGPECGNKKLRVVVNRNGAQMTQDEYIDMMFDGNHISYEQAKQHIPQTPF